MNYYYITGVSRGIGRALAEELLKDEKNFVYGISRTSSLEHERYAHRSLDLTDVEEITSFYFRDLDDADRIVLINNAGTLGEIKRFGNLSNLEMFRTYNLNILAPSVLMNNFIAKYQDHDSDRLIINISSGAANNPYDGWSTYCASKAATNMISRVAAREQELTKGGIKVLAIAPGVVETEMQEQIRSSDEEEFSMRQKFIKLKKDKALYLPEEVAREFVKIINDPDSVSDVVHRIVINE